MATMSLMQTAVAAQVFGWLVAKGVIGIIYPAVASYPYISALIQGLCAAYVGHKLESPPWWLAIHAGFPALVLAASNLHAPPGLWLGAFVLLILTYWRTDQSRVPLYLSNKATSATLAQLIPNSPCVVLDLGCGSGGLLHRLARSRHDCRFIGIEHAPLPWLIARIRCLRTSNVEIRYGNFWKESLSPYSLVYAFLSPAAMPQLWVKARTEMGAHALLVSNSFSVPDQEPVQTLGVNDGRRTQLLCFRPGASK